MAERTPALDDRLEEIKGWYNRFDRGHDRRHVEAVVKQAIALAEKHAPEQVLLAEIAAVYHDAGLVTGRDGHEVSGAHLVMLDPILLPVLNDEERLAVSNAVLQHRASTGAPETMLERIVADADRAPISTAHAFMRAFVYGQLHFPQLGYMGLMRRAAHYAYEKYGPEGYGRHTHFPETSKIIAKTMQPIFDAYFGDDLQAYHDWLVQEGCEEAVTLE